MKKQIILMIGIMLILGFTMGVISNVGIVNYFDSIEDARNYADGYLNNKENLKNTFDSNEDKRLDELKLNYNYTTDKYCEYNYDSDDFQCFICYEFDDGAGGYWDCANVPEKTTREQDDILVREHIKNTFRQTYQNEEIKVKLRDEKDRKFN